jgi:hypothetical protein
VSEETAPQSEISTHAAFLKLLNQAVPSREFEDL